MHKPQRQRLWSRLHHVFKRLGYTLLSEGQPPTMLSYRLLLLILVATATWIVPAVLWPARLPTSIQHQPLFLPMITTPDGSSSVATSVTAPTVTSMTAATPVGDTSHRLFGVLQADTRFLETTRNAGVQIAEFELDWKEYEPQENSWNSDYIQARKANYQQIRQAGFVVLLDFGLQYPPEWAKNISPWKDQYGNTYNEQVNAVWSLNVRGKIERYIAQVFQDFGTDFWGVRLGSGGWIETLYPDTAPGFQFSYWAFDDTAMVSNPVPNWRPGQPSPHGEARRFYTWYIKGLIDEVNWQQKIVRQYYQGYILQLFAGIGVRPAAIESLISDNLTPTNRIGVDAAERGAVYDQIIGGIDHKTNVIIVSTSLGDSFTTASWVDESATDPMKWSSAHWIAYNANKHGFIKFAENTGNNTYENMQVVFEQMKKFDYQGLLWAWDRDLYDDRYANIHQYAQMIAQSQ